jgi:hypothetical protein
LVAELLFQDIHFFAEENMWKLLKNRRGVTLVEVLVGVCVVVVIAVIVIDVVTCDSGQGICTSRTCTNDNPCSVDLNGDGTPDECIVGTACTNPGTICEKHWFTANCVCATVAGQAKGSCAAVCRN